MGEPWTPAREATLREMWLAGKSAQVIGNDLGITRNAVIGKTHRLKLPTRVTTQSTRPNYVFKEPRRRNYQSKSSAGKYRKPRREKLTGAMKPVGLNVGVLQLSSAACCYVTVNAGAESRYCGCTKTHDSSYCSYHHYICHVAP